ncbi:MAG: pseudouridine synthase [Bacteroidota bacterium]|uniref:pseudouridine synthase n=1 Tax=Parabacteroides sp. FAFU027 TaxID=2922715 RepID=UPI001FAFEA6A|nr:pseudouridine synthase [Parabacteroides sp. FAFU027]MDP4269085.1 pseudouridine synthase [Bacteroidota bacterium]
MKTEREHKRPRIGSANKDVNREGNNYERGNSQFSGGRQFERRNDGGYERRNDRFERPSQGGDRDGNRFERPRREGGYEQRQGGYNREGGNREGGFRREGGYNREGGFNREGGNREGGFRREGGYNREGGNREGGFRREGGYNREGGNREGGFRREGGYNREGGNREGGFRREGGFNREGGNREGGFDRPRKPFNREGGYNNRDGRSNDRPFNRDRNFGGGQGGYNRGGGNRPGGRPFQRNDRFNREPFVKPKEVEYNDTITDPNEPIRLNKFLANAGICSRREADEFIQAGVVKVNGEVVTELGTKVHRYDQIHFHDDAVKLERKIYVLLNKPKDCVTTADDPQARTTVMELVKEACHERIYPVGRLDKNTTGVLLLTNDGDLASKLMHPKFLKKKIYHVWLDKDIPMEDLQKIADGIELEDGEIHADAISYANEESSKEVGIEIHSGRNRIVRRIFEHLGYRVMKLDRVYFAGLTKKNLPRGRWRYLTQQEVNMLRMGAFE